MPAIVLRESQGGVVGTTGTVTTIAPDGTYDVAPFINERVREARSRGRVEPDAQAAIARAIETHAFATLPPRLGGRPVANPREISLTVDGRTVTLILPPGPETVEPGGDPVVRRLLAIVDVVRAAVRGPRP